MKLSNKLRQGQDNGGRFLSFWCPGCDSAHTIHIDKPNAFGAAWSWNGDVDRPSFSPSLNVWPDSDIFRCHSFVSEGRIRFLADSGHKLRGQDVELPDWPIRESSVS